MNYFSPRPASVADKVSCEISMQLVVCHPLIPSHMQKIKANHALVFHARANAPYTLKFEEGTPCQKLIPTQGGDLTKPGENPQDCEESKESLLNRVLDQGKGIGKRGGCV